MAPHAPTSAYRHNRTGEDNADAHLKPESWDAKSLSQSPKANSISARQNKFCTGNSTAEERSEYSSNNRGLTPALNECGALENTVALLAIPGEAFGKDFYFASSILGLHENC